MLGMHDGPAELLDAREIRGVALVIVVVAAGEEQEPAAVEPVHAVVFDRDRPGVGDGIPVRRADIAVELSVAVDAVLVRGGSQILADVLGVGDAFLTGPRLPRKGQHEHAAVGAHPRVPKQIPRAADPLAPLQDGVRQMRVAFGDPIGRAKPGDSGTDDDDVEVIGVCRAAACGFLGSHCHREPRLKLWDPSPGGVPTDWSTKRMIAERDVTAKNRAGFRRGVTLGANPKTTTGS